VPLSNFGLDRDEVRRRLDEVLAQDLDWRGGKTYAYVYDAGAEVEEVGREAFGRFLYQNALDPTAFPSARRLENDLVSIVAERLRAGPEAVGTFTSGGTESILLAVKAAREHARATRGIERAEVVLPTTAHAAFHKAADYLGLKVVLVDVDPVTFRADPAAMARAITPSTALLVGSAPSYPHGVIDPIPALGALALERGLLLHVDACVGGWLLPAWRKVGADVPEFDLGVPGVTSISVDLHKYAFAPKGASLVLYNDPALRRRQYFACTEWSGYGVVNPAMQSSKSAGPVAAAWAVVQHIGERGYEELARRTLEGTRRFIAGVRAIEGLEVLGAPDFCLVAVASRGPSVFHITDELLERGFYVQPQLRHGDAPASLHLCLGPENAGQVDALLDALRASVEAARALPSGHIAAAVQGALGQGLSLPELLGSLGLGGGELPRRMAPVHELLDALPPVLRKALLSEFMSGLFTPARAEPALA
jgi:sphinganine-1-phosphate aldolase